MCEACRNDAPAPAREERVKLWEIDSSLHCSIVGTCLSMQDLRRIAAKARVKFPDHFTDYLVHAAFVKSAATGGPVSKLISKALNKKHRDAITACKKLQDPDALRAFWRTALKDGDIPGAYWALMTHQNLDPGLSSEMFGDVHMLSHLVGAANRADLQSLKDLKDDTRRLSDALEAERARSNRIIAERDREVGGLKMKLAELADGAHRAAALERRLTLFEKGDIFRDLSAQLGEARARAEAERKRASSIDGSLQAQRRKTAALEDQIASLHEDLRAARAERDALEQLLETALGEAPDTDDVSADPDAIRIPVLSGRSIVYVGGRTNQIGRFRSLVEKAGGRLLHHDGGLEDGTDRLEGALAKGDVVFCPIDCVSHSACLRAKAFCKRAGKCFLPLRSAGLSSFVAGLHEVAAPDDPPTHPHVPS